MKIEKLLNSKSKKDKDQYQNSIYQMKPLIKLIRGTHEDRLIAATLLENNRQLSSELERLFCILACNDGTIDTDDYELYNFYLELYLDVKEFFDEYVYTKSSKIEILKEWIKKF